MCSMCWNILLRVSLWVQLAHCNTLNTFETPNKIFAPLIQNEWRFVDKNAEQHSFVKRYAVKLRSVYILMTTTDLFPKRCLFDIHYPPTRTFPTNLHNGLMYISLNSLVPGRFGRNFRKIILKLISVIDGWGILWNCPQMNVTGPYK